MVGVRVDKREAVGLDSVPGVSADCSVACRELVASMVKDDEDGCRLCGSDPCDKSAGPVEGARIEPASLSSSFSLLKGDRGSPMRVVRRIERFLSGVGESGASVAIPFLSCVWSGRGENATDARSMLGA